MASASFALLPGDGIGPEVMASARTVLERVGDFDFDVIPCGGAYFLEHGRDWPEDAEGRCDAADVLLLAAVGHPSPTGPGPVMMPDGEMAGYSAVLGNRSRLDLYANLRPVKVYPGVLQRILGESRSVWASSKVDMLIYRENTEGLYAGAGGTLRRGGRSEVATDVRIITRAASERICRRAFEAATLRSGAPRDGRSRVTAVAKHNVMDGCRFFVEVFREVAADFPEVEAEVAIVDAFAQSLITEPDRYDVVVTTNLFGDIVTDIAAVLQGGMGMAVGCNLGDSRAMFEPIHGSAPDIAGQGRANPLAMILAASEALRWLGRKDPAHASAGDRVEAAVAEVVAQGECLPPDLGGTAKTAELTRAVLDRLS